MIVGRCFGERKKLEHKIAINFLSFWLDKSDLEGECYNFLIENNCPEIHINGFNFLPLIHFPDLITVYELLNYRGSLSCKKREIYIKIPHLWSKSIWKIKEANYDEDRNILKELMFHIEQNFKKFYLQKIDFNHTPINTWSEENCEWCKNIQEKFGEGFKCKKHAIVESLLTSSFNYYRYYPSIICLIDEIYNPHGYFIFKPTRIIDSIFYTGNKIFVWKDLIPFTFDKTCNDFEKIKEIVKNLINENYEN